MELLPLIGEAIVGDHGLALMAEADGELKGALVALVGRWFGTRAAYIAAAKSSRAASRPMWQFLCRWAQARRAEGLFASYRGARLKALHRRWGLEPVAILLSRRLGDNAQSVREA